MLYGKCLPAPLAIVQIICPGHPFPARMMTLMTYAADVSGILGGLVSLMVLGASLRKQARRRRKRRGGPRRR